MAIQVHLKRYERQFAGAMRWRSAKDLNLSHSNGWGTWWWETGVGKTFAACDIAIKMITHNNSYTFIVVVPSEALEVQWKAAIKQFVPQQFWDNFSVYTVHKVVEAGKQGNTYVCTCFFADELHEYYTDERLKMFDGTYISTRWCLGLTANYEDIHNRYKLIEKILPVVDRIDSDEAVREGYISKYIEYNVAVSLTEQEEQKYKALSQQVSKNLSKFGHGGLAVASKILQEGGYAVAIAVATNNGWRKDLNMLDAGSAEIASMWNPQKVIGYAKSAMDAVRDRKTLLYTSINKLKLAKNVVIKFDDLKTICFSQSTAYADTLAAHINHHYYQLNPDAKKICVVYHSKLKTVVETDPVSGKQIKKGQTRLRKEAIEAIRTGEARVISTASSLDRGFDVKDIRLALTTSGTQNSTQYNQRKGRAVRVESEEEDIIVLIVNLYATRTMDEVWLRKRQSKSKNVVYWVDSVEDINYKPKRSESFNITEV